MAGLRAGANGSAATSTTIVGLDPGTANGPGEWSPERTQETGQPDHICDILDELDAP